MKDHPKHYGPYWFMGLWTVAALALFFRYLSFNRPTAGTLLLVQWLSFSAFFATGFYKSCRDLTKQELAWKIAFGTIFLAVAVVQYYLAPSI